MVHFERIHGAESVPFSRISSAETLRRDFLIIRTVFYMYLLTFHHESFEYGGQIDMNVRPTRTVYNEYLWKGVTV